MLSVQSIMLFKSSTPQVYRPAFIVTILYKSGNKFVGRFSKFVFKNGTLEYETYLNNKYPDKPLSIGIENIESIWYREER